MSWSKLLSPLKKAGPALLGPEGAAAATVVFAGIDLYSALTPKAKKRAKPITSVRGKRKRRKLSRKRMAWAGQHIRFPTGASLMRAPQPMDVVINPPPQINRVPMIIAGPNARAPKPAMPRHYLRRRVGRYRRRRQSIFRRRRRPSFRYRKRRTAFRRYRRARRHVARTRLRVYPAGAPTSKTVKLRMMVQTSMSTKNNKWCTFRFNPTNMHHPLKNMRLASTDIPAGSTPATGAPYQPFDAALKTTAGQWVNKDTGTISISENTRQAQGYDFWWSQYSRGKVLSCTITIQFMADANKETGERFIGGFTQLYDVQTNMATIQDKMEHIGNLEIIDMMNTKFIKNPGLVLQASTLAAGSGGTFRFHYNQKKYAAHLKRLGQEHGDDWYQQTPGGLPGIMPQVFFVLADIGLPTADTFLYNTITVEHVIQFSTLKTFDRSIL